MHGVAWTRLPDAPWHGAASTACQVYCPATGSRRVIGAQHDWAALSAARLEGQQIASKHQPPVRWPCTANFRSY